MSRRLSSALHIHLVHVSCLQVGVPFGVSHGLRLQCRPSLTSSAQQTVSADAEHSPARHGHEHRRRTLCVVCNRLPGETWGKPTGSQNARGGCRSAWQRLRESAPWIWCLGCPGDGSPPPIPAAAHRPWHQWTAAMPTTEQHQGRPGQRISAVAPPSLPERDSSAPWFSLPGRDLQAMLIPARQS